MTQMMLPGWECAASTKKYPHGRTGTRTGYNAHLKAGEPACVPCVDAAYAAGLARRSSPADPAAYADYRRSLSIYRQRLDRGEEVPGCEKPSVRNPHGKTGTVAGYAAHFKAGQPPCEPCSTANSTKSMVQFRGADPDSYAEYRRQLSKYKARLARGEKVMACEKPTTKHPHGRTGTQFGWHAHYTVQEPPCDACVKGNAADQRAYAAANPDHTLHIALRSTYQLSLEEYKAKLEAQNGKCAICGVDKPRDIRTNRFHVDHDHSCCPGKKSCGKCVRGLLCHACNTGLGNLGDDPERLIAAAAYLLSYTNMLEIADA